MIISRTIYSLYRHRFYKGDHLWQGETTYGATGGPGRPSMAAILGPGGPPVAINIATDGLW